MWKKMIKDVKNMSLKDIHKLSEKIERENYVETNMDVKRGLLTTQDKVVII